MNNITIELCAEDRARIDRLATALEALQPQTIHVDDPIQKALAEQVAKSEKTPTQSPVEAAEATEAETPATPQPVEETPTTAEPAPVPTENKVITQEQIQQKVVKLCSENGGAKKKQVAQIVKSYASKVSDIPEDKRAEVWDKLTALEMEGKA